MSALKPGVVAVGPNWFWKSANETVAIGTLGGPQSCTIGTSTIEPMFAWTVVVGSADQSK